MKQLFTLFILMISLLGFNSATYATEEGAKNADTQSAAVDDKKKKKKKTEGDEEPECE